MSDLAVRRASPVDGVLTPMAVVAIVAVHAGAGPPKWKRRAVAAAAAPPNPLGQPLMDPTGHVKDDAMIHPAPGGGGEVRRSRRQAHEGDRA